MTSFLKRAVPNFSWVEEAVLAGSGVPCRAGNMQELYDKGVRAVVSLTEDSLDTLLDMLPDSDAESSRAVLTEIRCLHAPVNDSTPPSQEQLGECCAFIEACRADGLPVLVHCAAGNGRTGAVLAAYLIHSTDMPVEEVRHKLRELRPGSVETASQLAALHKFASRRLMEISEQKSKVEPCRNIA